MAAAQTASLTLRELTITPRGEQFRSFAGIPQTFTPNATNNLVVNPPVDFVNRVADVTAVVDYSFNLGRETESGAFFSCGFTVPGLSGPATSFVMRVNQGSSSGSGVRTVGEGEMLLAEGIDRQYNFVCRITDPATNTEAGILAEAPIQVKQTYEPIDTIRIVSVDPPPSEPLTPGTMQTFVANVEYTRDVIRLGSQAMLVATDAGDTELVPRNELRQNNSAQQATGDGPNPVQIELTLTDVPVPENGRVLLFAEQLNGNQFGDFAAAAYQTYNTSTPVVYGGEAGTDFSIWHIEMNQAVQDDENLIPLVADRPTIARVFMRTSAAEGDRVSQVRLTLRRDGAEQVFTKLGAALVVEPDASLFEFRNSRAAALEFPVPREFARAGELEIEAAVNLLDGEPIVPEADTSNNTLTDTFRFFERDLLLIGYVSKTVLLAQNGPRYVRKLFPVDPVRGVAFVPLALVRGQAELFEATVEAAMVASAGLVDVAVVAIESDIPLTNGAVVYSGLESTTERGVPARVAAHLLRSGAEPCQPAVEDDFNAVGWDIDFSRLVRLDRHWDLLVACESLRNIWISPSRYSRLFLRDFGPQPAALRAGAKRQATTDLVVVTGEIHRDGSGSLSHVIRFPGVSAPPLDGSGEYCVEMTGAGGTLRHCMTPSFGSLDALPFAVIAPADAAANGVSLTRGGAEIDSLAPSASAPTIAITSPASGAAIDAGPALPVAWTASDADGDTLRTALFYSSDGGVTWAPLAANIEGDSYDVDTTIITGGEQVFLRAVVSDGIRTAQDNVGPLTVRQSPAAEVAASFDLGEGAAGVAKTVLLPISSTGTGPLQVTAANFDNAAFEPASSVPLVLLPGAEGGLLIAATPPSTGVHNATLTLETNADPSAVTVQLSVRGLDPELPILDVVSDNDPIEFVETPVNSAAQAVVSLINRGGTALTYQATIEGEGFSLGQAAAALTAEGPAQAVSLEPNQQEDLLVEFNPTRTGAFAGTLRVTSDASNAGERTIALSGNAVEASDLPTISTGGIVDAASFQATLTRGGIASIFGTHLASQTDVATATPLPTTLGGVRVLVDGVAAPLFFVSPNQINLQMPFEAPRQGGVQISVENAGVQGPSAPAALSPYGPAVFANPATGEPIVTRPDGSLITAASPAQPGDVLIVYITGIGDLDNLPASGAASGADPLSRALIAPGVSVGGSQAAVIFAGLTPGFVGLGQINIQLPAEVPTEGGTASLVIDFDGQTSAPVHLPVVAP